MKAVPVWLALVGLLAAAPARAADDLKSETAREVAAERRHGPGNLVRVHIKDHAEEVVVHAGDLVKFIDRFPVVPASIVSDFKIEMHGERDHAHLVGVFREQVVNAEDKPVLGVGEVAAYVIVHRPGRVVVKITPESGKAKKETHEFKVRILERQKPN